MPFTSWSALHKDLLDDLADGSWSTESYQVGKRARKFRNLDEFRKFLEFVAAQAALESGQLAGSTRAY